MLGKEFLNSKGSKLGQILCADKTGFRRLGHMYNYSISHKILYMYNYSISHEILYIYNYSISHEILYIYNTVGGSFLRATLFH